MGRIRRIGETKTLPILWKQPSLSEFLADLRDRCVREALEDLFSDEEEAVYVTNSNPGEALEKRIRNLDSKDLLRIQNAKKIVKEFIQQVENNEYAVFNWPPDPECPANKLDYFWRYIDHLYFERESDEKGSEEDVYEKKYKLAKLANRVEEKLMYKKKYLHAKRLEEKRYLERYLDRPPSLHRKKYKQYLLEKRLVEKQAKRFLDQLRSSWGYAITVNPPPQFSRLKPLRIHSRSTWNEWGEWVTIPVTVLVNRINRAAKEKGKTYYPEEILNVVHGHPSIVLVTLVLKEVNSEVSIGVRGTVTYYWGNPAVLPEAEECKHIPVPDRRQV